MTYCCITCEFDKARANNAPGRRGLRAISPIPSWTQEEREELRAKKPAPVIWPDGDAIWGDENSPVVVDRDTAAGATTSSVGGETPSELATPVGLGGQGPALDTYPRAGRNTTGVSGLAVRHEADVDLVVMTSECSEPRLGGVS